MMESPKVSVIIPVYNSFSFLKNAVDSVLPLPEVGEIILVDDGSTDGSFGLELELANLDSRIKVFHHPDRINKGAAESRNLGIINARFPYIAFLDSDDKYFPNRFYETLRILENNPNIDGVYGKIIIKDFVQKFEKLFGISQKVIPNKLFSYLLNGGYFHTNTVTIRRTFFEKVGYFNQKCWPHEDVEMWIRMARAGNLVQVASENPLAEYIVHGQNLSQVGSWKSKNALWRIILGKYFFTNISLSDRLKILRQFLKVKVDQLKSLSFGG